MNQDKDSAGKSSDAFSTERSIKSEAAATKGKLAELAQTAASAGKAQLDTGLGQAAGQVEQVARVIDETADRLKQEHHEGLAAYASQVAGSIESVANRLRNSSVDELATEARQLARSNPTLFLLGSVAVGFGLTRFLKASSRMSDVSDGASHLQQDPYGSSYGDSRERTRDWDTASSAAGSEGGSWDAASGSSGTAGRTGSTFSTGSTGGMGGSGASTGSTGGMGGSTTRTGSTGGMGGSSTSTGSSSGMSGSSSTSTGSKPGGDSLSDLRARPMFPEMDKPGATPGGTVGGSRTNEIGGGSHG